ncbi:MAG: nucleotidyltransferase domain-containing protein [Bacteroidales bacterium]|nr:nucleotidyltransferase domain-containing protein [Bacteroidales bacterium]MCF8334255.1 nucleotidyltransferase domain-containing protein [Bacteroidales bacterium]
MNKHTTSILQLIRKNVNSVEPQAEVILYGSRARGDEHTDSDWDILIIVDYVVDASIEDKFRDVLYDLELETEESLSVFVFSKEEWHSKQRITPFYENVNKEGITL